jgi:hypothetical protein
MVVEVEAGKDIKCFHCGQVCDETLWLDEKAFCCYGCRTVYEILSANQLCEYYNLDRNPGRQLKETDAETYRYLDEPDIRKKVVDFLSENFSKVTFYIPAIHTFFLGFVFSMIFAHGPIILPGVLGISIKPYHPLLYVWLFFLHASWTIRLVSLYLHLPFATRRCSFSKYLHFAFCKTRVHYKIIYLVT